MNLKVIKPINQRGLIWGRRTADDRIRHLPSSGDMHVFYFLIVVDIILTLFTLYKIVFGW